MKRNVSPRAYSLREASRRGVTVFRAGLQLGADPMPKYELDVRQVQMYERQLERTFANQSFRRVRRLCRLSA